MVTKQKITTLLIVSILMVSSFTLLINSRNYAFAASSDGLLQYEWPQFNGDSSFTRFSSGPAPSTSNVTWEANITNLQSYLAAFDGLLFATTNDSVVALDYDTGDVIWSKVIPMNGTWPVAYKLDDTRMLVESTCLETKTGKILWTSTDFCADTGNFNSNPYVPEEKMFYTKNEDSFVYAWNFSDLSKPPTLVWSTYTPGGGRVSCGITYGDGKVFPGSFQDQQIALDAKTGKILWTTETQTAMIFFGSYADGKFVRGGTDDNTMYCFDADTGVILWKYAANTTGYFTSGTASAYGMVFAPNKDGYIYAISLADGKLVWRYKGPGTMLFPGMPTVADGKVYVTSGQNAQYGDESGSSQFACLNAYSGKAIWTLPIEAYAPRESVAVAYGYLYLIPGEVTRAVDSTSGSEYAVQGHIMAYFFNKAAPKTDSWSMFRHDADRSSIGAGGPANLSLVWKFQTGGAVMSSPTVVNGTVYFGSQDHNIYAVNAGSGSLLWNFTTNNTIESSVAVADGKVITGAEDGLLTALTLPTAKCNGKPRNTDLPVSYGSAVMIRSSPAVINSCVYIGSLDGNLYALNFTTGAVIWKYQTDGWIKSSPTISEGAVYITSETPSTGTIFKIDSDDGALIWKTSLPYEEQFTGGNDMIGTPTVANGKVFTSANLRTYYALNAQTGAIIWTFTNPEANEFIVSSPIYLNGQVFVVDKFDITSLNATTGKKLWNTFTCDEYYVSPSYADGKIYIVTSERNIFIFDAITGEKLCRYMLPSATWSSPTLYGGKLYIGDKDWNLYCLGQYNSAEVSVTLLSDKTQLHVGESITFSGQILPLVSTTDITLSFAKPDGSIVTDTTATTKDGSYVYYYTPSVAGTYTVTASYMSESTTATSTAFTVTSESTITPSPSPSPSPTETTELPVLMYVLVFVVIILLVVAVVLLFLNRRR